MSSRFYFLHFGNGCFHFPEEDVGQQIISSVHNVRVYGFPNSIPPSDAISRLPFSA